MDSALHAEEVSLEAGLVPPPIFSTTGRRQYPLTSQGQPSATSRRASHKRVPSSHTPVHASSAKVVPRIGSAGSSDGADEASCYDMYGFRVTLGEKAAEDLARRADPKKAQTQRWEKAILSWSTTSADTKKRYCRGGIPQPLRQRLWQQLLGTLSVKYRRSFQGLYAKARDTVLDAGLGDTIDRDLPRTFPTNRLFSGDATTSRGQASLRNILRAYAVYNPRVGYCQGMGFLAATLLVHIEDEENTFWALCVLMGDGHYHLQRLYEPGFPQLHCCFYVLEHLLKRTDRVLYARMQQFQINMSFFATHWFLTLFSYHLNFSLLSQIWDMFLCEGWKPIYRVALAFLKLERKRLLAQTTDMDFLMALKEVQEGKEPAKLLHTAMGIKFKSSYVQTLTTRYYASRPADPVA